MNEKFAKKAYRKFLFWGICSSLGVTVSTLVDALLIGNLVGSDGLAVANLSTPVFLVYQLLGLTIGIGANVYIGRMLGETNLQEANRIFHSQMFVGLAIGAICLFIAFVFRMEVFQFLGVPDNLYGYADKYLTVVLFSAPIFVIYHILSASVRTDSDPILAAVAAFVVVITNLLLDILFMKGFHWGMQGASASLCIAETMGVLVLLLHFVKKRSLLRIGITLPSCKDVRNFVANGFGVGSGFIFQAVVMLVFNSLLLTFGNEKSITYVAVFGVIYTINMIPFAIFDGASNALSTVTSIFAGEKDEKSIMAVLQQGVFYVIVFGGCAGIFCAVFAKELAEVFGIKGYETIQMAIIAMRIFSVSIVMAGINTLITAFWQTIGRAKLSGFFSVVRNLVFMLLFGVIFIPRYEMNGLSISYICAEGVGVLIIFAVSALRGSKTYVKDKYQVSGPFFENNYVIQTKSMEQISKDLERVCDEWEIPIKKTLLINLIVEEMLLNIIKFGLKSNSDKYYINVRIVETEEGYIVRIRDNVKAYNPFESSGDEIDAGVLTLISKKTKHCDYQRKLGFNYLYLIV